MIGQAFIEDNLEELSDHVHEPTRASGSDRAETPRTPKTPKTPTSGVSTPAAGGSRAGAVRGPCALCTQNDESDGKIFFLMRGELTVKVANKLELERTTVKTPKTPKSSAIGRPKTTASNASEEETQAMDRAALEAQFGTAEEIARYKVGHVFCDLGPLPEVPIPGHESMSKSNVYSENARCTSTIHALPAGAEATGSSSIIVGNFPKRWAIYNLYEAFKPFGDVAQISFITTGKIAKRKGRWAQVLFVSVVSAQQATREKIWLSDEESENKIAEVLKVEIDTRDDGRPDNMDKRTGEHYDEIMRADAIVAELSLSTFNECCVNYLTTFMAILSQPPRDRTLPQLTMVTEFLAPTEFMRSMQSAMVRRNCARYLSLQVYEIDERVFKYGTDAANIYIVLRGLCELETGKKDDEILEKGIGMTLAGEGKSVMPTLEQLEESGVGTYKYTATATGDSLLVLAKVTAEDYVRTCSLEEIQKVIDMYWQLGIDFQLLKAEQRREAAKKMSELQGRGRIPEILEDSKEYNSVMRFPGYKQVYLRIGKSLASNGRYSQSDLVECLDGDWENDLEEFGEDLEGEEARDFLTREQYTQSLYQLIDEWSGSVESTKLYEKILQLILDNSSIPAPAKTDLELLEMAEDETEERQRGDPGYLLLKPLRQVECCFQKLADMRVFYQKITKADRVESKLGQDLSKGKSQFKALKNMKGAASSGLGALMMTMAEGSTQEDKDQMLLKLFNSVDTDGGGSLGMAEIVELSRQAGHGLKGVELEAAMAEMDEDHSGEVDFSEFQQWFKRMDDDNALLKDAFAAVDSDGSNSLDKWELETVLFEMGQTLTPAELNAAMRTMDDDDSGEVSFEEFAEWWHVFQAQRTKARLIYEDPLRRYKHKSFMDSLPNDDGEIGRAKLADLMANLGRPVSDVELDWCMVVIDDDGSGAISFEEFEVWYNFLTEGDFTMSKFFAALDPGSVFPSFSAIFNRKTQDSPPFFRTFDPEMKEKPAQTRRV